MIEPNQPSDISLTIRGRTIREPELWAIAGIAAMFTPIPSVLAAMLVIASMVTDSLVVPAALLGAGWVLIAWTARRIRSMRDVRLWAIGLWLVLTPTAVIIVGISADRALALVGIEPFKTGIANAVGIAMAIAFFAFAGWAARFAFLTAMRLRDPAAVGAAPPL